MNSQLPVSGVHPPQQARSRLALEKVLAASEEVLSEVGYDDFTMAAVAEAAGVSVGAIYRRFEGKEALLTAVKDRLLTRYEDDLTTRLARPAADLASVVTSFTHAVADAMSVGQGFFSELLLASRGSTEMSDRGSRALAVSCEGFESAASPFGAEIRRSEARSALRMVSRTVTGACIHRALSVSLSRGTQLPDDVSWSDYADELAAMAYAYLTTSGPAAHA